MKSSTVLGGPALCCVAVIALVFGQVLSHDASRESVSPPPSANQPGADPSVELTNNQQIKGEISSGHSQTYRLSLVEAQHIAVVVEKGDTSLQLIISDPNGRALRSFVSHRFGPLRASFITNAAGTYRLEMHSLESDQRSRPFQLHVQGPRPATGRDKKEDEAVKLNAEAERLRAEWKADSLRAAISKYEEAETQWQAIGGLPEASATLLEAGDTCFGLSDYPRALDFYRRALNLARVAGDKVITMRALNCIGYVHANTNNNKEAEPYIRQALHICEQEQSKLSTSENQRCLAQANNNLGEIFYFRGDLTKARDFFNRALELHLKSGDRHGLALAQLNLGYTYSDSGFLHNSHAHLTDSLALWRALHELRGEALTHTAQGMLSSFQGEKKRSFDSYRTALQLFRTIGDRQGEAATLNSTGKAYEDLNAPQTARDHYTLALKIFQETKNRDAEAVTLYYLGRVCRVLADDARALVYYEQSQKMSRTLGKRRIENYALIDIASIRASRGEHQQALADFSTALDFYRHANDRRGQAHLLKSIGDVYFARSNWRRALGFYQQALGLSQEANDHRTESALLFKVALVEQRQGNLEQAISHIEAALRISESMRTGIDRQDLRASLFAEVHDQFGLYIDLLMRMNERQAAAGFAVKAFEVNEAARTRSLLETLAKADLEVTRNVSKELLERERVLQDALAAGARNQIAASANGGGADEANKLEQETRRLTDEYQDVRAQIREQGLRNAAFVESGRFNLPDLQKEILDDDTVLLEFFLGKERSYLWAVTRTSFDSYELPPAKEIESVIRDVHQLLTDPSGTAEVPGAPASRTAEQDQQYWEKASTLSHMLLGKAAGQLRHKRLLIVPDGALQYISFDALPSPSATSDREFSGSPVPLIVNHEIVSEPSSAILAALRRRGTKQARAPQIVAVLADPVFEPDDPRFAPGRAALVPEEAEQIETTQLRTALQDIRATDDAELSRLPFSLQEAKAIIAVAPESRGIMLTGFDANRARVVDGELRDYRIVHFATHGVINCRHPELSGVVLSMLNERGERENGFLQLHDIYKLDWSTDLVVLSACSTALGQDIRGEGLVGLTQGFLHSGANSVVSTLWTIDDRASAELMRHFYEAMLKQGLAPSAALTEAKRSMWRGKRWQSPYYWGAFVLQGDYRQTLRGRDVPSNSTRNAVAAMILFATIGLLTALWHRSRKRKIHAT